MRLAWLSLALALVIPVSVLADSAKIAAAVERGDDLDRQLKTTEALAAYLEAEKLGGRDAELLRKIAREYALAMPDTPAKTEKRALGEKSVAYARRAVAADPENSMAHLALAICYGRLAPLLDNKTKIAYSKLVKEHAEKSIALDATNDYAYHILGAWHYEMAGLNALLRTFAKMIYGAFPPASYQDAAKSFKMAISLSPQRVAHHVEIGRTYAAMGQSDLARASLQRGIELPSREKDDPESKQRARAALEKL